MGKRFTNKQRKSNMWKDKLTNKIQKRETRTNRKETQRAKVCLFQRGSESHFLKMKGEPYIKRKKIH